MAGVIRKNNKKISQLSTITNLSDINTSYAWIPIAYYHISPDDKDTYNGYSNFRVSVESIVNTTTTIIDRWTDKIEGMITNEVTKQIEKIDGDVVEKATYAYDSIQTLVNPISYVDSPIYQTIAEHFIHKDNIDIQILD